MVRRFRDRVNAAVRQCSQSGPQRQFLVKAARPISRQPHSQMQHDAQPSMCRKPVLDNHACDCETALNQKLPQPKQTEETMNIDRRELMLPALAAGLLSVIPGSMTPAFAGADEDTIAKNLEAFRAAQAAGNAEVLAAICAEELSYSHSRARSMTRHAWPRASPTQTTNGRRLNTRIPQSASSARPPSCVSPLSANRNSPTARRPRRTCTS